MRTNTEETQFRSALLQTIALPILILIIFATVLLWQMSRLIANSHQVDRTDQILTQSYHTQKLFLDIETGLRGYVITRNPDFLQPYIAATPQIYPTLLIFRQLVSDNPALTARIAQLEKSYREYQDYARILLDKTRTGDHPEALVRQGRGKRIMDEIWSQNAAIVSTAQANRVKQTERTRQSTTLFVFTSIILTLLFGGVLAEASRRRLNVLSLSYRSILEQLRTSHLDLEKKVEERTQNLQRANHELKAFHLLVQSVKDYAIFVLDQAGIITNWNPGAERIKGYRADEIIGKHYSQLFTKEDRVRGLPEHELQEALKNGRYEEEAYRVRKDGTHFFANVVITPLLNEEQHLAGFVVVSRDITDRKKTEVALNETNRELESFSYSVSHDLRAPLRSIDGFSQALVEDYGEQLDDTAKDYLRRIRNGVQKMGKLIDDLLNLSRISRAQMSHELVDLTAMAMRTFEELQRHEPERKVNLKVEEGLQAYGDPGLLEVVLQNLLSNAWKFTAKKPVALIEFGTTIQQGKKVYYVRDNGAGFDMAYINKLFGAFQRLHRESEFPGSGIGLATVRRIIHRHGGEIWAEGETDKGAVFYFTLGQLEWGRNRNVA